MEQKEILIRIGESIRYYRELRGEKIESMAVRLQYKSGSSYAKLERGECETLDVVRLMNICTILDIPIEELCKHANIAPPQQDLGR